MRRRPRRLPAAARAAAGRRKARPAPPTCQAAGRTPSGRSMRSAPATTGRVTRRTPRGRPAHSHSRRVARATPRAQTSAASGRATRSSRCRAPERSAGAAIRRGRRARRPPRRLRTTPRSPRPTRPGGPAACRCGPEGRGRRVQPAATRWRGAVPVCPPGSPHVAPYLESCGLSDKGPRGKQRQDLPGPANAQRGRVRTTAATPAWAGE